MEASYIFRKATVQAVDNVKHLCRVKYEDLGYVSSWIYVPGRPPYFVSYEGEQRTEFEGPSGSGDPAFERHRHLIQVIQWMPKVGDVVVVACDPDHNGDAYVLGGLY